MPRSLEEILDQADHLADVFEHYEPEVGDQGQASALIALRLAVARRADADRALLAAVTAARAEQFSWSLIGTVVGTSGEAARQRYGDLVSHPR